MDFSKKNSLKRPSKWFGAIIPVNGTYSIYSIYCEFSPHQYLCTPCTTSYSFLFKSYILHFCYSICYSIFHIFFACFIVIFLFYIYVTDCCSTLFLFYLNLTCFYGLIQISLDKFQQSKETLYNLCVLTEITHLHDPFS